MFKVNNEDNKTKAVKVTVLFLLLVLKIFVILIWFGWLYSEAVAFG